MSPPGRQRGKIRRRRSSCTYSDYSGSKSLLSSKIIYQMLFIVTLLLLTQLKTSGLTLNGVIVNLAAEHRPVFAPSCVSVVSHVLAVSRVDSCRGLLSLVRSSCLSRINVPS